METLVGLWMPILVSSVLVFIASSLVWTVLGAHKWHIRGLPDEAGAREALAKQGVGPGMSTIPFSSSLAAMKDPAYQEKLAKGPVAVITVREPGVPNMGKFLGSWFLYVLFVSYTVAFVCGQTLGRGTPYMVVFKVAGAVALAGYSYAQIPAAIWWGRPWKSALKEFADGILYAALTAGSFGWLWPD